MDKMIYIHHKMDSTIGFIFDDPEISAVFTGIEVLTEEEGPELTELERRRGLKFFRSGQEPELPLYGVPVIYAFAMDDQGGCYVSAGLPCDGKPVYRVGPDCVPRFAASSAEALLAGTTDEASDAPFRVFPSREAAEEEFPIRDSWEVLRQSREPRFQIWPMESPKDREGKAFVHYQSWIETYTGLMDGRVLASQTLERCRRVAERFPENTFVLLDRERDDRVAGFACYLRRAREFVSVPDASEIVALYVLREYQGLGLGRMLMEHCLAWLHRPNVALMVLKGNEKAIGFYEHMGFRLTGREQTDRFNGGEITELEMVLERGAST